MTVRLVRNELTRDPDGHIHRLDIGRHGLCQADKPVVPGASGQREKLLP